jgi:predicted TIM-barrel fold metal-dependent hydrolase
MDAVAKPPEHNLTGIDYRKPMPRPKVNGITIDFHCHLLARRHAKEWFEAADHYGIDCFLSMTPLEEVVDLLRDYGHRIQFIAVPKFVDQTADWADNWLRRLEMFYNLGSRMMKFHAAPRTIQMRGHRLDEPVFRPMFRFALDHKMAIMTHIGDPELWYSGNYADAAKYGTHAAHFQMWENLLNEYPNVPWVGAHMGGNRDAVLKVSHMGGNPEDLHRLQSMLDRFPNLMLDCSVTRWMVREISARRDKAREFFIRNQDRILFGTDQVSMDDRGFDFLASRFWSHRKLWETAYIGQTPILDPDVPADKQPILRGMALPDEVLQKLYHDNAIKFLAKIGTSFGGWG